MPVQRERHFQVNNLRDSAEVQFFCTIAEEVLRDLRTLEFTLAEEWFWEVVAGFYAVGPGDSAV